MNFRALLRRALPYIVIGIGGFALAYVVIFVFVLPSKIVPSAQPPYVPDSSKTLVPIDTGIPAQAIQPPVEPPPVSARIVPAAPPTPIPAPDLVGMSLPDARGVLDNLRLNVVVTRDTSSFEPPNTVLRQQPPADSMIAIGANVILTVSYFPRDSTADTMRVRRDTNPQRIRPAADTLPRDTTQPR